MLDCARQLHEMVFTCMLSVAIASSKFSAWVLSAQSPMPTIVLDGYHTRS